MRHNRNASLAAIAAALIAATPALGQAPSPDPNADLAAQKAKLDAEAAKITAETNKITAETAKLDAQKAALGISDVKGEVSLGEGAGEMEAWILAAGAMDVAAKIIAGKAGRGPVFLTTGDEALALGLPAAMILQMDEGAEGLEGMVATYCQSKPALKLLDPAALAAIGTVLGALKSDVAIKKVEVSLEDRALLRAVAGQLGGRGRVLSAAMLPGGDMPEALASAWSRLKAGRAALLACRTALAPKAKTDAQKADITRIDTALTAAETFAKAAVTPEEDGLSPLLRAGLVQAAIDQNAQVLRVSVEKAGGSTIQKTNLWTMIGLSEGISVTGGFGASYLLVDPRTGKPAAAGTVRCRTDRVSFDEVHLGREKAAVCLDTMAGGRGVNSPPG